jgi:hypothetical protein
LRKSVSIAAFQQSVSNAAWKKRQQTLPEKKKALATQPKKATAMALDRQWPMLFMQRHAPEVGQDH